MELIALALIAVCLACLPAAFRNLNEKSAAVEQSLPVLAPAVSMLRILIETVILILVVVAVLSMLGALALSIR